MQARNTLRVAAVAGFSAVAFGAFGAHGLKGVLAPELMTAYQTGVQYHLVHAVVLLVLAAWSMVRPDRWLSLASGFMTAGLILFSGSLYALALTGERKLGMITPIGGVSWLIGWALLLVAASRIPHSNSRP
ncbi:DUF423 domain-containing protein [Thalassolituus oleivorans]|jgi:uncharacterized membrane protein YgdD (TMEM256/DUF423 family)|uniref:DUF423 domain-containing protein n=2 Tax=root TaxID=1 RepID=M5DW42_9GAMM|nr:DUF423 domain-containing protein [Thalassolituus oleivorans]AHK17091.1 membrane protein [Thalassolituus oleivorans R6-15]CCU74037.1 hypothetical protein TOL_3654 [Thalassolituus oleivorans MIL-1]